MAVYEPGTLTVDEYGDLQGIPGPCISRYQYDALNRRVQTIEHPGKVIEHKTMHVYGGGAQVLAEYDVTEGEAGPLARWFVHGESFPDPLVMVDLTAAGDQPAGISEYLYYLKDALGSVGALANEAGEVVERNVYDPYGNTTVLRADGTSGLPILPAGYYFDADLDLTITLADYDHLLACSATPGDPICVFAHDYNRSGTVDGDDVGTFEAFLNDLPMPAPEPWRREVRAKLDADGALAGSGASVPILDLFDFDGLEICFAAPDALCLQLYDIDNDGTLTLSDEYAAFVSYFTGPNPTEGPPDAGSRFGNPFLWTGQRYEPATGLYHFLYRSYDPALGRWLQKDPLGVLATGGAQPNLSKSSDTPVVFVLGQSAGDEYADGLSLHQYGLSDPVGRTDRSGQFSLIELTVRIAGEVWLNAAIPGSTALGMWAIRGVMAGIAAYNAYLLATDPEYLAKLQQDVAMCAGVPGMTATMEHIAYLTRYARMVRVAAGGTIEAGESLGAAAGRNLTAILLDRKWTKRYVDSLETLAARSEGRLGALDRARTDTLWKALMEQGYRLRATDPGPDYNWIGGLHVNIVVPGGGHVIHLPVPPGWTPPS